MLVLRTQVSFFVLKLRRGVYPHPGVFWPKSSESVENKGAVAQKVVKSVGLTEKAEVGSEIRGRRQPRDSGSGRQAAS